MKKLTAEELLCLEIGQRVELVRGTHHRSLYFAGKNPTSENALIFCNGSHIEQVYVYKDKQPTDSWFIGEIDYTMIGKGLLNNVTDAITSIKKIYFDERDFVTIGIQPGLVINAKGGIL